MKSNPTGAAPAVVARPETEDMVLLAVGVTAVSMSGPIIAATAAPALAIAMWRNALGTAAVLPFALVRRRAELRGLGRRERRLALAAGVLLALHFGTWIPSLDYTSVAVSTALVSTQPVWAALLARATGHHVPARAWTGIAIALLGVLVLTGVDVSLDASALWGDLLALVGAFFAAAYMAVGSQVRRSVSTVTYTTLAYGTCAVLLLVAALAAGQQIVGYDGETWAKLAALTVAAQLLGHSVFNRVLRTTSPTVVSLTILLEAPGAAVIAAVWLGQVPPLAALPAAGLLLLGIAIVVGAGGREAPASAPAE